MVEVQIKPDKYGQAIALLFYRGEGFQTRFERVLLVSQEQRRILEDAGFVTAKGNRPRVTRKQRRTPDHD